MQEILKFLDLTATDATMILVAIPLFVLFIKGADKALIRPFLDRLNARDALTIGAGSSADEIVKEAIALEQDYARKTAEARAAAVQAKNSKLISAKEQATQILQGAETEIAVKVSSERQKVRHEVETQRAALLKDVDSLAQEIVKKLSQPRALSIVVFLIAAVGSIFLTGDVFAEAEHASHGYGYLFWYWINFIVYVVAMYFILRKFVASGWDARRERIRYALEAGKRSMDEAQTRRRAAQDQSAQLDKQLSEITSSIEREAALESQKLIDDAKARAIEIQQGATESLGLEAKAQRAQMQREIAEIVLARANEMLRSSVTKESDRALRQGTVTGVKSLLQ